ncbi:hypothetical protein Tco_0005172 [Tanacetum coccineum]
MEECHRILTDQVDLVNPKGHRLVPDVSKPLPLGGPPGDKGRRSALSISKLKAAQYLDFGLEELVSSLWIESEHEYDISVVMNIRVIPKYHSEDGNPARANIKQALGRIIKDGEGVILVPQRQAYAKNIHIASMRVTNANDSSKSIPSS